MNGWYRTKNKLDGSDIVINLDTVNAIMADPANGCAVFFMSRPHLVVYSAEKYSDVIRSIFGPEEGESKPEEGEDDGEPRDPSGFNGILPM